VLVAALFLRLGVHGIHLSTTRNVFIQLINADDIRGGARLEASSLYNVDGKLAFDCTDGRLATGLIGT
jgi:hypothetical protein